MMDFYDFVLRLASLPSAVEKGVKMTRRRTPPLCQSGRKLFSHLPIGGSLRRPAESVRHDSNGHQHFFPSPFSSMARKKCLLPFRRLVYRAARDRPGSAADAATAAETAARFRSGLSLSNSHPKSAASSVPSARSRSKPASVPPIAVRPYSHLAVKLARTTTTT